MIKVARIFISIVPLDIKGNPDPATASTDSYNPYSGGLNGTQIEIAPNRDLQIEADNDTSHQLQLGISSVTDSGLRINNSKVDDIDQARATIIALDNATYLPCKIVWFYHIEFNQPDTECRSLTIKHRGC